MSGNLQPKDLFKLAFRSFITYMENEARQLMKLDPSPEAVTLTSRVCRELKRFFHGMTLPSSMANELTKHLLIKLDRMYYVFASSIRTEYCHQMLLSLVDVFMHPDVTAIELSQSYYHEFSFAACSFITLMILAKDDNLHKLRILNLPESRYYHHELKPVFPSQLKELTIRGVVPRSNDILRSIVESCPELKSLTMCDCDFSFQDIPLLLQCKHLETLRLSRPFCMPLTLGPSFIKGLSTNTASDVLSASTLKAFSLHIGVKKTLRLIVDKLPHLTEIELANANYIDLSSLTQLKNLRSLSLEALDSNDYKKILPVLGKNLVFLELKKHRGLDLELIGETCTHLKCLHLCDIMMYENVSPSLNTIPNFKTIECLKLTSDFAGDVVEFVIAQCVNIKTLIMSLYLGNPNTTIDEVLSRTPPLNWVVIHYNMKEDGQPHLIDSLPSRHPNFHVVKTSNWIRLSPQAEVFESLGCFKY